MSVKKTLIEKKNQNLTFFVSFLFRSNLLFAFKSKDYRVYHVCVFKFIDWLISLVHQFSLFHLNKHQLVEILLTARNCYQL